MKLDYSRFMCYCRVSFVTTVGTSAEELEMTKGDIPSGEFPPTRHEDALRADPELTEGPPSGVIIALFAFAFALLMVLVFYGLKDEVARIKKPQCPEGYICTKIQ